MENRKRSKQVKFWASEEELEKIKKEKEAALQQSNERKGA